jgi:hypothetical protein
MSRSDGIAIPLAFATSDSVLMQFSTLTLWSTVSHDDCETRKAAPRSCTNTGWRVWSSKKRRIQIRYNVLSDITQIDSSY